MTEEDEKIWKETVEGLVKLTNKDALNLMAAHLATLIYDFKDRQGIPNIDQATTFVVSKFNGSVFELVDTITIDREMKEVAGHA